MFITKSLPSILSTKTISIFLNKTCRTFSSDILNHRVQTFDPNTGKQNDRDSFMYHNIMFSAYL